MPLGKICLSLSPQPFSREVSCFCHCFLELYRVDVLMNWWMFVPDQDAVVTYISSELMGSWNDSYLFYSKVIYGIRLMFFSLLNRTEEKSFCLGKEFSLSSCHDIAPD